MRRRPGHWLGAALRALPDPLVARLAGPPVMARGHALDPRLVLLARANARQPPFHQMSPAEARAASSRAIRLGAGAARPMARVEHRKIPGAQGFLPVRVYHPHGLAGPRPLVLYFHQGGCVIGDLDWCEPFCTRLAERARCRVLSVDYRLGPEHRFPAAQEDAVAAYRWALSNAGELDGDPERLVVAGDSAGGGLAAHITHAAKRAGEPQPRLQILVYPWVEAYANNDSYREFEDASPLDPAGMRWFLSHYANDEQEWQDPRLSPLRESDFGNLAPALIATAGFDPLCDEGHDYARKLEAAGVPVRYRCYASLSHSFTSLGGIVPAASDALDQIADDLERVLTGGLP
jgi:acetyl esterase/lipase